MNCYLCPRKCGADRTVTRGFCGGGDSVRIALETLHFWEEPCISGKNGSGTIFFSGCPLKCEYCQNFKISHENFGIDISIERLREIFYELQSAGAHNINLVTPTQYVPWIIEALRGIKLGIPVIYNTGGYENVETLKMLDGSIDVYLPDLKFSKDEIALRAIHEMVRQRGKCVLDDRGMIRSGVIIRHLILPGGRRDSIKVLNIIKQEFGDNVLVSIMSQFTPNGRSYKRRICTFEYESVISEAVRLELNGYMQEMSSADKTFIPAFDLRGI